MIVTPIEILMEISLLERIWVLVIVLYSIVKEVLIGREREKKWCNEEFKLAQITKNLAYYKLV